MFEVSIDYSFSAGHALRQYRAKCENLHGHNYKVRVTMAGEKLNDTGLLMDFTDLREAIRDVASRLDHQFLNDLAPFDKLNPSAENIARYFCDALTPHLEAGGLHIAGVTVWETDVSSATYRPIKSCDE